MAAIAKSAAFGAFKREKGSMASFHGALGLFLNAAHDGGKDVRGGIMDEALPYYYPPP